MSAADHYAQAEQFLSDSNSQGTQSPDLAVIGHALLAIAGFLVQFSTVGSVVLSEDARDAQRVVEE
jgi:hypothetical protein